MMSRSEAQQSAKSLGKSKKSSARAQSVKNSKPKATLALSVHSGLLEGAFFPLTKKKNIIGRNIDAIIPIKDSKVSREHASIDQEKGMFFIRDLGSTNGTYVNNERVATKKLIAVGDNIRIGSYTFRVERYKQPAKNNQKAQEHKWSSETKILFRDPSLNMIQESTETRSSERARAASHTKHHDMSPLEELMKISSVKALAGIDAEKIKWVLLAIGIVLVFAASVTRIGHFS